MHSRTTWPPAFGHSPTSGTDSGCVDSPNSNGKAAIAAPVAGHSMSCLSRRSSPPRAGAAAPAAPRQRPATQLPLALCRLQGATPRASPTQSCASDRRNTPLQFDATSSSLPGVVVSKNPTDIPSTRFLPAVHLHQCRFARGRCSRCMRCGSSPRRVAVVENGAAVRFAAGRQAVTGNHYCHTEEASHICIADRLWTDP